MFCPKCGDPEYTPGVVCKNCKYSEHKLRPVFWIAPLFGLGIAFLLNSWDSTESLRPISQISRFILNILIYSIVYCFIVWIWRISEKTAPAFSKKSGGVSLLIFIGLLAGYTAFMIGYSIVIKTPLFTTELERIRNQAPGMQVQPSYSFIIQDSSRIKNVFEKAGFITKEVTLPNSVTRIIGDNFINNGLAFFTIDTTGIQKLRAASIGVDYSFNKVNALFYFGILFQGIFPDDNEILNWITQESNSAVEKFKNGEIEYQSIKIYRNVNLRFRATSNTSIMIVGFDTSYEPQSSLSNNLLPTFTPRIEPSPISTLKPQLSPTSNLQSCTLWSRITLLDVGRSLCIIGVVYSVFTDDVAYYIRFGNKDNDFYLLSYAHGFPTIKPNQCVKMTGKVKQLGLAPVIVIDENLNGFFTGNCNGQLP